MAIATATLTLTVTWVMGQYVWVGDGPYLPSVGSAGAGTGPASVASQGVIWILHMPVKKLAKTITTAVTSCGVTWSAVIRRRALLGWCSSDCASVLSLGPWKKVLFFFWVGVRIVVRCCLEEGGAWTRVSTGGSVCGRRGGALLLRCPPLIRRHEGTPSC